jgi:colanic acid biosynthesis glycosyl transferase WcaI
MRILIYSINYFPELTGIGKYNAEMAEWLAAQGHEVVIITAPPYYPWWQVQPPYRSWLYRTEQLDNVRVYRCPLWVPRRPTGVKRLLHLSSFALSSIPLLLLQLFKRPDVLIALEPTLFCAPAALGVARLSGAKTWLHVQDFEVDAALGLGMVKAKVIGRSAERVERWLMGCFNRVSTISDSMFNRLAAKGVPQERIVLLPNWVDLSKTIRAEDSGLDGYRAELGISADAVVALYSGSMGMKQGLDILAQAAMLLRDEQNLVFVFCGNGAGRADLVALCGGLPNVRFMDLQPLERLGELLAIADIHLLPQRADVADLVMPSKLLGMLASGRPVLTTAHPGTQLAKVVSSCGKVVEPGNAQAVAQGLLEFLHAPHERELLGTAARQAAKAWDKTNVLRDLERQLQALCNK